MKKLLMLLAVVGIVALGSTAAFAGMSADGDLSDWGITLGTWGSYNSGVTAYLDPARVGDKVDPGYGGNLYDAYAMYCTYDATNVYVAFVSGFPQAGRTHATAPGGTFYPGDLAFKLDSGAIWTYGIRLNNVQGTYSGVGDFGGIYSVADWQVPYEGSTTYAGYYSGSAPTVINSTIAKLGDATVVYTGNLAGPSADPWYVVEAAIPFSINIPSSSPDYGVDIHWTMTCGNDALNLHVDNVAPPVPEPISTTLFLLGGGAMGLRIFRRKKA